MKNIAVFTGAGMSAESGLKTFRDMGGLWEQYRIEDVATPEAFARNPDMVMEFYNMRLKQLRAAKPNAGHIALAKLESHFNVHIVTQNVDDLHERAGASKVLHLHGELTKCRNIHSDKEIYDMPEHGLKTGDCCPDGYQLRPHIVWFGEMVPAMQEAERLVRQADLLLVVGTSLNVYPAAGLIYCTKPRCSVIAIDPEPLNQLYNQDNFRFIKGKASQELPNLVEELISKEE